MRLGGLARSSTIDFPGCLSCVIFTIGCNYDCFYCHNRDLIVNQPPLLSEDELDAFLEKRKGLLDGVVISGGEPTLQKDLSHFISKIRKKGFQIKLDTNGCNPAVVKNLLEDNLLDYVAVDFKAPPEQYKQICGGGADYQLVLETLHILSLSDVAYEGRTTLYPGLQKSDLICIMKVLPILPKFRINYYKEPQVYRPWDDVLIHSSALTKNDLLPVLDLLKNLQPNILL